MMPQVPARQNPHGTVLVHVDGYPRDAKIHSGARLDGDLADRLQVIDAAFQPRCIQIVGDCFRRFAVDCKTEKPTERHRPLRNRARRYCGIAADQSGVVN